MVHILDGNSEHIVFLSDVLLLSIETNALNRSDNQCPSTRARKVSELPKNKYQGMQDNLEFKQTIGNFISNIINLLGGIFRRQRKWRRGYDKDIQVFIFQWSHSAILIWILWCIPPFIKFRLFVYRFFFS